jgi:hypothetical protein
MVELPIRNSTGLLPLRLEPGTGRAVIALAMLSGVLSITPFTSFGASATWASAVSDEAANNIDISFLIIFFIVHHSKMAQP